jgi:hypothetical protein
MKYPNWITAPLEGMNLREVGPHLFVGEETSPLRGDWHTIIDFYGHVPFYVEPAHKAARRYIRIPFDDGREFPAGALDAAWTAWQEAELEGGDTLLHCQAGLSRSASAAYALLRRRYGLRHDSALARVVTPVTDHQYPMKATLRSAADWVRGAR